MDDARAVLDREAPAATAVEARRGGRAWRWAAVLAAGGVVWLFPAPDGVSAEAWRLAAIFTSTILGLILQPLPGGAVVLLGVLAVTITGVLSPAEALAGYADPIVWLVLAAFFMSRGMLKTGLGRRIALWFIRRLGSTSLGLGYALACTDTALATIVPSNSARSGGIVFPITMSLAETYESRPGPTARRLGAFLLPLVYQCDVIICAMFLTGQASNVLIARFALDTAGVELSYAGWALAAIVPGLAALIAMPLLLFALFPPEVRRTPGAARYAAEQLERLGPASRAEKLMLGVFVVVAGLWITTRWHGLDYAVVALLGIGGLLLAGVLDWEDLVAERRAWDVFIWYGGLVQLGRALGESGLTRWFADEAAGFTDHGACDRDVHPLPHRDPRGGRPAVSGRPLAGVPVQPVRIAHALRHDAGPDLLRRRLRRPGHVVADRTHRIGAEPADLAPARGGLVEGPRAVVTALPEAALSAAGGAAADRP